MVSQRPGTGINHFKLELWWVCLAAARDTEKIQQLLKMLL